MVKSRWRRPRGKRKNASCIGWFIVLNVSAADILANTRCSVAYDVLVLGYVRACKCCVNFVTKIGKSRATQGASKAKRQWWQSTIFDSFVAMRCAVVEFNPMLFSSFLNFYFTILRLKRTTKTQFICWHDELCWICSASSVRLVFIYYFQFYSLCARRALNEIANRSISIWLRIWLIVSDWTKPWKI